MRGQEYLAPRGSIVTLLLRGFCSDLFIHGKGGAKYDPFVDSFAVRYLGITLPSFCVASFTQYAFPEKIADIEAAIALKSRYKEMVSHTARFLGLGLFSEQEESVLAGLADERVGLLASLKGPMGVHERSRISHALNDLNRRIRQSVDSSSLAARLNEAHLPEAVLARWRYREYPFFLWTSGVALLS